VWHRHPCLSPARTPSVAARPPTYHPRVRERFLSPAILPRLPGLMAGLVVFGIGIALMAQAGLGLGPWEAFHQGIGLHVGMPLGTVSIILGIPILALWWPLGERLGVGTLLNVATIGVATNAGIALIPAAEGAAAQLAMMVAGVLVIGLGSGLYLAADLGPGPRDGLMTGIHHRFRWSIRRARTSIEVTVLVAAWLLGGTIGLGTVVFAVGIGPVVQVMLGIFDREGRVARRREIRQLEQSPGTLGE